MVSASALGLRLWHVEKHHDEEWVAAVWVVWASDMGLRLWCLEKHHVEELVAAAWVVSPSAASALDASDQREVGSWLDHHQVRKLVVALGPVPVLAVCLAPASAQNAECCSMHAACSMINDHHFINASQ